MKKIVIIIGLLFPFYVWGMTTPDNITATDGTYPDKIVISNYEVEGSSCAVSYTISRYDPINNTTKEWSTYDLSYEDTDIIRDCLYSYKVKACGCTDTGTYYCTDYSDEDTGFATIPAPKNVQASEGHLNEIYIDWDYLTGISSYQLYRSESPDGPKRYIKSTTSSSASDDDDNCVPGVQYYYFVKGCFEGECGPFSAPDGGYRGIEAVTSLVATDGKYTDRIDVYSELYIFGATYFKFYRSLTADGEKTLFCEAEQHCFDTKVSHGQKYYYFAKACSSLTCSGGYGYGDSGFIAPEAPENVQASDGTFKDKVTISFDSVTNVQQYEIYRSQTQTGSKMLLDSITTTTYEDDTVERGKHYYYFVKACDNLGCSDFSQYDTGYSQPEIHPEIILYLLGN